MPQLLVRPRAEGTSDPRARQAVRSLFGDLHAAVGLFFAERRHATRHRRSATQRRLLHGLELMFKLEEEVLHPALLADEPGWEHELSLSRHEIELLRDLAQLTGRTTAANRDLAMAVLHGLAGVHFARIDGVLLRDGAHHVDWTDLLVRLQQLLGRWRSEIRAFDDLDAEEHDIAAPATGSD